MTSAAGRSNREGRGIDRLIAEPAVGIRKLLRLLDEPKNAAARLCSSRR